MYNPNAKRRRIKPYARPTSFDYNVRFDIRQYQDVKYNRVKKPFFQSASNDECFRVMEGELLVKSNSANARYNDKELHVFSFANGLTAPQNATIQNIPNREFSETTENSLDQQKRVRVAILSTIQYMGVAVTEFHPGRDVYEQGMVATIAGLNTLYNNGAETIYPGQTVCLDLPVLREASGGNHYKRALQMGVPREKLQFILRPHQDMVDDYGDVNLVNRFIVGTAISYSRPGDTVDVILHRMNYTSSTASGHLAGLGSLGPSDPRSALVGGFLERLIGADDLDHAYNGVVEFEEIVMRISSEPVRAAIDQARGFGLVGDTIEKLMITGGILNDYDRMMRLQILREKSAEIETDAATKKFKNFANDAARQAAIQAIINKIEANPNVPLTGDEKTMLFDDVTNYLKKNKPNLMIESAEQQAVILGLIASTFARLIVVGNAFMNEFQQGGDPAQSLFVDRNAAVNPGTGLKTYDGNAKPVTTVVTGEDLAGRSLSLKTSVPTISAAVGVSKSKKKK